MNYEDFQHLARLFVVGALDGDEMEEFQAGRRLFGPRAEAFLQECRKLNAAFALSLRPRPASPEVKAKLFARIRAAAAPQLARDEEETEPSEELACDTRAQRRN